LTTSGHTSPVEHFRSVDTPLAASEHALSTHLSCCCGPVWS